MDCASTAAAGETFSMSVTVPMKTTSSDCNPGQTPGGAFEHVQAETKAGQKRKIGSILKITREVIVDILHGAECRIESAGLIFGRDV
jgi:hypothetical protein